MSLITVNYNSIWQLDFALNYHFTKEGKCYNTLTGREIKKVVKGYSVGFNIKGKFYTVEKLRGKLIKVKKVDCPF